TGVIVPAELLPVLGPVITAARDDAGVGGDAAIEGGAAASGDAGGPAGADPGSLADGDPPATAGGDPDVLSHQVAVLTPRQAKGLAFDCVVVVEPGWSVSGSPRRPSDLYVALTRATRRLAVVHTGQLPEPLAHLA